MPSLASAEVKSCCWSSLSRPRASLKGSSAPVTTARLMRPTAAEALLGAVKFLA